MSITAPKPCTEKWDNMSPSERGGHCSVCQTEVVDFTDWKTDPQCAETIYSIFKKDIN